MGFVGFLFLLQLLLSQQDLRILKVENRDIGLGIKSVETLMMNILMNLYE